MKAEEYFQLDKRTTDVLNNQFDLDTTKIHTPDTSSFFDLAKMAREVRRTINKSKNPRLIVLECWMLLDFFVRYMLSSGLDLNRFEPINILPIGLRDCLVLLEKLKKDQLSKLEYNYSFEKNPSLIVLPYRENPKFRQVDDHWLTLATNLNPEWFKKASKLNDIRNQAAHKHNTDFIYKELGINGSKKIEELRKECLNILNLLIKFKR